MRCGSARIVSGSNVAGFSIRFAVMVCIGVLLSYRQNGHVCPFRCFIEMTRQHGGM
jgi:hypothetical protein